MKIGVGWKKKDKNGKTFLSLVMKFPLLGELSVVVYPYEDK